MHEVVVTVVGNVVADPRSSQTRNGVPYTTFRVASTSRRYDRQAGALVKGDSLFLDVRCWQGAARNAAATLAKGSPVIVQGRLRTRTYVVDSPSGPSRRSANELEATALGLDLARLPAAGSHPDGMLPQAESGTPGVAA